MGSEEVGRLLLLELANHELRQVSGRFGGVKKISYKPPWGNWLVDVWLLFPMTSCYAITVSKDATRGLQ